MGKTSSEFSRMISNAYEAGEFPQPEVRIDVETPAGLEHAPSLIHRKVGEASLKESNSPLMELKITHVDSPNEGTVSMVTHKGKDPSGNYTIVTQSSPEQRMESARVVDQNGVAHEIDVHDKTSIPLKLSDNIDDL